MDLSLAYKHDHFSHLKDFPEFISNYCPISLYSCKNNYHPPPPLPKEWSWFTFLDSSQSQSKQAFPLTKAAYDKVAHHQPGAKPTGRSQSSIFVSRQQHLTQLISPLSFNPFLPIVSRVSDILLWFSSDTAGHSFSLPQPLNVGTQHPCSSVFWPLLLSIATHISFMALHSICKLMTSKFLFYISLHFQSIYLFPVYTSVLNSRLKYPVACSTSSVASLTDTSV